MRLGDILRVPKLMLKECPFTSVVPTDWLNYLNKVEEYVRKGLTHGSEKDLVIIYEYAIDVLPELWNDESYTVIMIRLAILKGTESFDEVLKFLIILNLNAPSNARLMIALAHYFTVLGNMSRAASILDRAKTFATCDLDKRLLEKAIKWYKHGLSFRPLMGIYDYVPTNTGAWGNRLGKGPSLHKGFLPDLKERLKPSVYGFKSPDVQNESSNGEKSDSNVSDISMEVVDSELQSPIRRPPWPLQRIGEEDEEAEAELENRVESKKTDMESLVTAQIPFQPSSVQTFDESSCVHMSSQLSTSEDDSGAVTVQPGLVSVKSTLFLGRTGGVDKENVCQQPPPPPLSPSSSTRHRRVSWAGPREALARLKKAETREMKVMEEAEADPISALVERSNVVVDGEKFIVLRQIARGGFSSVFCVMNKKREMLALKRVGLVSASADVLEVCRNEVDLLLSLRESGRVIALYNYELSPSHLVMVLELAEQDLKSHLKMRQESGSLPDHVVTFLWNEMLACVKVIHDRQRGVGFIITGPDELVLMASNAEKGRYRIVHLDLKPENFVIVRGMLKLIDLGISQRLPVDCTHMDLHKPMGSIVYMSPEQLSCIVGGKFASSNDGIDAKVRLKTDVWALGVILYEMLHGRSPFGRTQQAAIMSAILSPTVSINFPHVDNAKLDEALRRCLVRDIRERASIDDLLEAQTPQE